MSTMKSEAELRQCYPEPPAVVPKKVLTRLDRHAQAFIALSPFVVLATRGPDGADCSPRGDAPGFVVVLDDQTLLLPDRRGNNMVFSLRNVLHDPAVGMLFMVPGINETLRVNGVARIISDPERLAPLSVQGKAPSSALEISVREMFFHCAKALIRSELWNPEKHVERASFPSYGKLLADQIPGVDETKADTILQEGYKKELY